MSTLVFQAHQGLPGLQRLTQDWTQLLQSMRGARFNHSRAGITPTLRPVTAIRRACGSSQPIAKSGSWRCIHCSSNVTAYRSCGRATWARWRATSRSYRISLLHRSADNSSLVFELTRWLRVQRRLRWDVLRLLKVAENSSLGYAARIRRPRLTPWRRTTMPAPTSTPAAATIKPRMP